jgi:DNA excision repair protein ERCC-2
MLPSSIPFRYDTPREGQEKLITDAHQAFLDQKIFLAHAETGLGKTDASLSAALGAAMKSDPALTIIFLTPKNAQHAIAVEALRGINAKYDLKLRVIDLVGKKHLCIDEQTAQKEGRGFYEMCRKKRESQLCVHYGHARGYDTLTKEKAKIARQEFLVHMKGVHSAAEIKDESSLATLGGEPWSMCPYETSMELAKKANVIIADYFHIFSPSVSELVLPKLGKKPENCLLIVDEAHNLPERVRSLLSTTLNTKQLLRAAEEATYLKEDELATMLQRMEYRLREHGKKMSGNEELLNEKKWQTFLAEKMNIEEFSLVCEARGVDYLEKSGKDSSTLIQVGEFLEKWANEDEGLARVVKKWGYADDYSVGVKALDPSPLTKKVLEKMHACLLMSGTLHPLNMFADILGVNTEKVRTGFYASPFPKKNRLNLIAPIATTKYSERSEESYTKIAEETGKIVNQIPGNSVVFFPSFQLLDNIGRKMQDFTMRTLLFQREGMKMHETEKLIQEFKQHARGFGSVLLACTSGSFAEGLDFPGNELLGVIVVGIPLAEMNLETHALVNYYEKRFNKGWHYGYIYPAMNKALQAAGRVIRTPTDEGIIVFLDKRYTQGNYSECFPPTHAYENTSNPSEKIKAFWSEKQRERTT